MFGEKYDKELSTFGDSNTFSKYFFFVEVHKFFKMCFFSNSSGHFFSGNLILCKIQ